MRARLSKLCLGVAVAMLVPGVVAAQGRPVELGLDMGLSVSLTNDFGGFEQDNVTTVSIPRSVLRVGFFASDVISIEPSLSFDLISSGGSTVYTLSPSLGMLYHFSPDRTRSQVYAGPFFGLDLLHYSNGTSESLSQFNAGVGIGVKLPVADKLAVRLTAAFAHVFESEDDGLPGANVIAALIGFSFFTK